MASFLPFKNLQHAEIVPDYPFSERFGAAFDLAKQDTFTATQGLDFWGAFDSDYAFGRDDLLDKLEKGDPSAPMDPEELNERFPFVEKPFDKPTSFLVADHLNREGKKRRELMDIISNGGNASSASTIGYSLLGGLGASMTDPVEAGADVALSLATFGAAGIVAKSARAARIARDAQRFNRLNRARKIMTGRNLGLGGKFLKESAEGVTVNAAMEPILFKSSQRAQQDYDELDAFTSVAGGGIGLPAMKAGVMGFPRVIRNNSGLMERTLNAATKHMGAFKKFGHAIDYIGESVTRKIRGTKKGKLKPDSPGMNYSIRQISPEEIPRTKFYMAGLRQGKYRPDSHQIVGDYHGDGYHITDNPNVANNTAQIDDASGSVHELNIEDANLLDMDTPTKSDLGATLRDKVPEENLETFDKGATLRESINNVKNEIEALNPELEDFEIHNRVNEQVKSLGYDGYRYHEVEEGNHAFIFSDDKIKHDKSFDSDFNVVPDDAADLDASAREKSISTENDIGHIEAIEQEKIEMEKWQREKQKLRDGMAAENEKKLSSALENYEQYKDTDIMPEDLKTEFEGIVTSQKVDELEKSWVDAFKSCIENGGF